jgi:hypothetical protein
VASTSPAANLEQEQNAMSTSYDSPMIQIDGEPATPEEHAMFAAAPELLGLLDEAQASMRVAAGWLTGEESYSPETLAKQLRSDAKVIRAAIAKAKGGGE